MNKLFSAMSLLAVAGLLCMPARAAENTALTKDLTATLALLGLPCGQVVQATMQGPQDHLATCSNGNRYRVYINAQGRVTAEKR